MQTALVVGTATSTVKHSSMEGWKLLIVQPLTMRGTADGDALLAVDALGAGTGEEVLITSDGASTRELLNADATPVRWCVIGIVDEKEERTGGKS